MAPGKLIVLEGTDGSGKGTQLALLTETFKSRNIPYATLDFPRYGDSFFGDLAGKMLRGDFGGVNDIPSELAVLPFAADRWLIKNDVLQWLREGKVVLSNRYTASSAVYQASKLAPDKQAAFVRWVYKLEQEIIGLPTEDLVLYLHIPVAIAQTLVEKKQLRSYLGDKKRDIYEENGAIQLTVERLYGELAANNTKWKIIECVQDSLLRTPDQIQKDILDVLTQNKVL
jgi:dTMP kinase